MGEIDYSKISPELKAKLAEIEKNNPANRQLQSLEDIASMVQELLNVIDDQHDGSQQTLNQVGALLAEMNAKLASLNDKETPEQPDYAKPVVSAVEKLEKALTASIKKIDTKPVVNVPKADTPQVNVEAPEVDLRGVEKILKNDLPKSFKEAIKLIPETQIPKSDYTPLLDKLERLSEQLESIDNATRIKPQFPNTLKVTNPDGTYIFGGASTSTGGTSTGVSVGTSSTTVLAANTSRLSASIVNDSDTTVYLKLGSGASLNSGIRLNALGGSLEIDDEYTGIITGISSATSKNVTVQEV